jgi:tetratricopeptide (TPR) repeat protein
MAGDSDRAVDLNHRALAIATGLHDDFLQEAANYSLGVLGQARGDYRDAAERLRGCSGTLHTARYDLIGALSAGSVAAKQRLAWCLAELGEFAEAMTRAEEAARIAREADHPASLVFAYRSLGLVSLRRGAVTEALPPLERAVGVCRAAQVRVLFDVAAAHLGYAYALSGRLTEGLVLLEEALADPVATGTGNHPLFLAYLGEAYLLAGRRDDAITVAQRALALAHRQKERGNEAWVLRLLGEIAAQADPPDVKSAEEHYRQALARADELGMRPLVAHCHFGLGKLYRRIGKRQPAQEHLTTATTIYREMSMTFWLGQAETELAEFQVSHGPGRTNE